MNLQQLLSLGKAAYKGEQTLARLIPAAKSRVLQTLEQQGAQLFNPENAMGATLNPRTGKLLEAGKDTGNMMATIPNPVDNSHVVRNLDELLSYAKKPEVMKDLQSGAYLGTWRDPDLGGLVVDPSRRYLSRTSAMIEGAKTNQKAGFDLGAINEFPLNTAQATSALRKTANTGLALGGLGTAALAADYLPDQELSGAGKAGLAAGLTGAGILAGAALKAKGLPSNVLPEAGYALGRILGPKKAVLMPKQINDLKAAGVQVGKEGELPGVVAKNRARAVGVPEESLANIADDADELTAFEQGYKATFDHVGKMFNAVDNADEAAAATIAAAKNTQAVGIAPELRSAVENAFVTVKPRSKPFVAEAPYAIDSRLVETGVMPVRHISDPNSISKLVNAGEGAKIADVIDDTMLNMSKFLPEADIAAARARGGTPIFYTLHSLSTRARAAIQNMPLFRLVGAQGPASAAAGPITENILGQSAANWAGTEALIKSGALKPVRDFVKTDGLKGEALAAAKASNKARTAEVEAGGLINPASAPTSKAGRPAVALGKIEDDIVKFMKNPASVPGILEKVWTYMGSTVTPNQNIAAVMDSWMMRAAFGNPVKIVKGKEKLLGTVTDPMAYRVVHKSLTELAKHYGISPAAIQEIIWKNIRIATKSANEDAFLPDLRAREFMYPNLSATAKQIPAGAKSVAELAKTPEMQKANTAFMDKVLAAIKTNPEIAKYVEIVGQDIQFTDEFFKDLNLAI